MSSPYYGYGWLIPAEIETLERRCYCIELPNKPEYQRAFYDLILQLTRWFNWERDENHRSREVSRYLTQVILPQMDSYFMCNTNLRFRNNPIDLCQIQSSDDGGQNWNNAWRLDLCPNDSLAITTNINVLALVRLNILNRYDGINITTININAPTTNYDGDASPNRVDGLCNAVSAYVRSQAQLIHVDVCARLLIVSALRLAFPVLQLLALAIPVLSSELADLQQLRVASSNTLAINDVICCMKAALAGAPVTRAEFEASLDTCGFVVGSDEDVLSAVIKRGLTDFGNWASFIDALGNGWLSAQGGAVDCPDCDEWCYTWDFTLSDGGWTTFLYPGHINSGIYTPGVGWQQNYVNQAPPHNSEWELSIQTGNFVVNHTEITFEYAAPSPPYASDYWQAFGYNVTSPNLYYSQWQDFPTGGTHVVTRNFTNPNGIVGVAMNTGHHYGGGVTLTRLTLRGVGTLPAFTGGVAC